MEEIPVYLFTGFMDSGKTSLILETLFENDFTEEDRGLIIACEDGEVEYEVRPGTQTDTKVRLKGKGVPSLRAKGLRGDHYVTLVVQVPERMTQTPKEALRRFDEAMTGGSSEPEEKPKKKGFFKY